MGSPGSTLIGMPTARDPWDRLLDRCVWVGGCLIFQGKKAGRGRYGQFRPGTRSTDPLVYVHRWVYEQTVGPIPEGYEIDHVAKRGCTSTACINPEHLEPVTHGTNRARSRLTICRSGRHDLTLADNQRWDSKGQRRGCAACHRDAADQRQRASA